MCANGFTSILLLWARKQILTWVSALQLLLTLPAVVERSVFMYLKNTRRQTLAPRDTLDRFDQCVICQIVNIISSCPEIIIDLCVVAVCLAYLSSSPANLYEVGISLNWSTIAGGRKAEIRFVCPLVTCLVCARVSPFVRGVTDVPTTSMDVVSG